MMKQCKYCGKALHEQASFCPFCMQSQIEKQTESIHNVKPKKWILVFVIGIMLLITAIVIFIVFNRKETETNINHSQPETTVQTTTVPIETTTVTTTQTNSETVQAITTESAPIVTDEIETTISEAYTVGDYITDGKTLSQIQGYGGYENPGGIILTIEEITSDSITFSIVQYSESGLSTETISARNITAEMIDNRADFEFRDMLDGMGTGVLTFENGKIHIQTYGDESTGNPTSIVIDEWLKS